MNIRFFVDLSREAQRFGIPTDDSIHETTKRLINSELGIDQIALGALLRIAIATEEIAEVAKGLQREMNAAKRRAKKNRH